MHLRLYKCSVCKTIVLREKEDDAGSPPICGTDNAPMTNVGETFLPTYASREREGIIGAR